MNAWIIIAVVALLAAGYAFVSWRKATKALKQRLEESQSSETQFRLLTEKASDLITVTDTNTVITYQSPSSERVLGFKPEDMVGKNLMNYIHTEDQGQAKENLQSMVGHPGELVTITARFKHRDGGWRRLEAAGHVVTDGAKPPQLILNTRDVTESTKLQEQMRQAQKMEAVGALAGGVAHDFNNILAANLMQLSLLQQDPHLSPELRAALKDMEASSNRAAALTRQLLLFSRRQVMEKRTIEVNQTISGLVKTLRRILGENIEVLFHSQPEALWISADAGMIEHAVTNLCINARDAMPEGGGLTLASGAVEFSEADLDGNPEARQGKFVYLSVADTGRGMSDATLKQIFDPFFTTKEMGNGTGLGLATVFGIVKQHQGWIEAHSEVGLGSVFRLFIPAAEAPAPIPGAAPQTSAIARPIILIVEDNKPLRELTSLWLKRIGYDMVEAADGLEAMEQWNLRSGKIDLLLTDMIMPNGVSGLDLAEKLRAINPTLKVIIASGYSLEIAKRTTINDRGYIYLAKPYEGPTLASIIRQCLDGE